MNIPQIQIRQQSASINLSTGPARLKIRQPRPGMQIQQAEIKLEMRHRDVKVEIDGYPHRHDLGYKNIEDFRKENVRRGLEAAKARTAKYATQGDSMMRIENKGNPLQNIIEDESFDKQKEIGLRWKRGPRFKYIPPDLNINWEEKEADLQVDINPPQYEYIKGGVDVNVERYAKLDISVKENKLDIRI